MAPQVSCSDELSYVLLSGTAFVRFLSRSADSPLPLRHLRALPGPPRGLLLGRALSRLRELLLQVDFGSDFERRVSDSSVLSLPLAPSNFSSGGLCARALCEACASQTVFIQPSNLLDRIGSLCSQNRPDFWNRVDQRLSGEPSE